MKNIIKRLMCVFFGCEPMEEVYATELYSHKRKRKFYRIVRRVYCARCGNEIKKDSLGIYTRTTMLRQGWFIIEKKR